MATRILVGDVRERLAELPDGSVHCVVSSPPYFGLRDYGTAAWEGGDVACDHRVNGHAADKPTPGGRGGTMPLQMTVQRNVCGKCGALRVDSQIGLEETPAAFVATMVDVFREVRRVLRGDGTLWLNLGDSYVSGIGAQVPDGKTNHSAVMRPGNPVKNGGVSNRDGIRMNGLLPKNLIGIPWRVAFALQADGWYLRQDIIWSKPNPMPESVTDRCTKSHEYLFLLSKSARYFYDAAAIAEAATGRGHVENAAGTRNRRSVWTVATQPFSEAHFATFPPALIEPCIMAGCPKDCCAKCGAPWARVVEKGELKATSDRGKQSYTPVKRDDTGFSMASNRNRDGHKPGMAFERKELGWAPSCSCKASIVWPGDPEFMTPVPGTVLDPFLGAGTTGMVADRLGRDCIGVELNPEYAAMARRRIESDAGLFASFAA